LTLISIKKKIRKIELKRLIEIESKIRDSQIVDFYMNWNRWEKKSVNQDANISIQFVKRNIVLVLKLKGLKTIDIYEDEFNSQHIGHLKCLMDENEMIWLILDPYDERINEVEERDNFKLCFKEYELEIKEQK